MGLIANAENIRSEMSRHRLTREAVCSLIGMHPNLFSMYASGHRPLYGWAGHNIGWGINTTTGLAIFDVNMELGPVRPPRGRPVAFSPTLPSRKRGRRRRFDYSFWS